MCQCTQCKGIGSVSRRFVVSDVNKEKVCGDLTVHRRYGSTKMYSLRRCHGQTKPYATERPETTNSMSTNPVEVPIGANSDAAYIISEAQKRHSNDRCAAKSWVIVAKLLFPNSFEVQYEAYKIEKEAKSYQKAARCFGFIALNFPQHNKVLWNEINELILALRATENEITPEQEFYVRMFEYLTYEVQSKILLLVLKNTENTPKQCRLMLLVLKRFPQVSATHLPRLIEMVAEGMKTNQKEYQEMLINDIIPFVYQKTPDLPAHMICPLFTISLEHYVRLMVDEDSSADVNETWDRVFRILNLCGGILRWEKFLPFNRTWSQSIYWDKLIEIVSCCPAGSTQVLFYATTLFLYSLHCYIKNCSIRADDADMNHVLVEGFTDWEVESSDLQGMEPPQISITSATSKEISSAFVNAAQCWQLLNTDQFHCDFSKLLLKLPLAPWISRFLFDLAIYFGHQEEAKKLMGDMGKTNVLVQNLQILSLSLLQGQGKLSPQGFECIVKIVSELPPSFGQIMEHLTFKVPRHMIFIPLSQNTLVQYCTKAIIRALSRKVFEPNCPDEVLGDLLVLLQLEYPRDTFLVEQIFSIITTRRSFCYRHFTTYLIMIDFLEEFLFIWHSHNESFQFDFHPALISGIRHTIGTRGSREDFRSLIKQQITRSNDNLTTLIASFIVQEQLSLMKAIFGSETDVNVF